MLTEFALAGNARGSRRPAPCASRRAWPRCSAWSLACGRRMGPAHHRCRRGSPWCGPGRRRRWGSRRPCGAAQPGFARARGGRACRPYGRVGAGGRAGNRAGSRFGFACGDGPGGTSAAAEEGGAGSAADPAAEEVRDAGLVLFGGITMPYMPIESRPAASVNAHACNGSAWHNNQSLRVCQHGCALRGGIRP